MTSTSIPPASRRELADLLRRAFRARAFRALGVTPSGRRFTRRQVQRRARGWAGLAGLLALCWTVSGCTSTTAGSPPVQPHPAVPTSTAHGSATTHRPPAPVSRTTSASRTTQAAGAPVHVNLFESDGATYGIGMPIVMRFTKAVTDARAFEDAVTVRVDGAAANGAWYWERSGASGYAVEAHYRMRTYWPAHSRITVNAPLAGLSAGRGLTYDDSLTLAIKIGDAHVSTVDASAASPGMTVRSNGRVVRHLAASLGKADTPTYHGTKLVMEFDRHEQMGAASVPWSVRLTNTGEFVHAAPWNSEIGQQNLSHGCTNLSTADAEWFYNFSQLGDVVEYPNAPGPTVQVWDGLGDWNLSWSAWHAGGLLPHS